MTTGDVQLYIQIRAKVGRKCGEINYRSDMMDREHGIGVQKVFRIKATHYKKTKSRLPIIFMAKLSKGAKPIFINYEALREHHPYLLIEFFEKRVQFHSPPEEPPELSYHPAPEQHIEIKDTHHELHKEEPYKPAKGRNSHKEWREKRELRELRDNLLEARDSREERELREPKREQSMSVDSRPLRTCRLRSDLAKDPSPNHIEPNQDPEEQGEKSKKMELSENVREESVHQRKNILDYDYLVESAFCLNLISPAVIPSISKLKPEQLIPQPLVPYQIPRINFKEMEREQYSSQEFKESEESEFLLDERSKEKKRKEKMLKQLQKSKQKFKRKGKKIKKKSHHHAP